LTTDIILVTGRSNERTIEELDMRCDAHEIPDSPDGSKADGYWLCLATMKGKAPSLTQGEVSADSAEFSSTGTAALTLVKGRLLGILGPSSPTEHAVWFTRPPTELNVQGIGSQGLLRKRPTELVLSAPDWELHATEVSMLLRHSGSYKAGEEGSLLAALGGASA
jgi:hypothetical protein